MTDLSKSNAGYIWSVLLATTPNVGTSPTETDLPALLARLELSFDTMGHMQASSGGISARVRVIYPAATIFAAHPILSLTSDFRRLAEALSASELQQIARAAHG